MTERLMFSMQDLGRLAHHLDHHHGEPLDLVLDWVRLYAPNDGEAEEHCEQVMQGYHCPDEVGQS